MSIELIAIIAIVILIAIILVFMNIKDKETSSRLNLFEKNLDSLNKSVFELKNSINAIKIQLSQQKNPTENIDEKIELLEQKLEKNIQDTKKLITNFMDVVNENVRVFKEKTKEANSLANVVLSSNNNEKIIKLFKMGKDIQTIARDLRLGIGEVEFTLKMAQLI